MGQVVVEDVAETKLCVVLIRQGHWIFDESQKDWEDNETGKVTQEDMAPTRIYRNYVRLQVSEDFKTVYRSARWESDLTPERHDNRSIYYEKYTISRWSQLFKYVMLLWVLKKQNECDSHTSKQAIVLLLIIMLKVIEQWHHCRLLCSHYFTEQVLCIACS
jgi:hypothetical protein